MWILKESTNKGPPQRFGNSSRLIQDFDGVDSILEVWNFLDSSWYFRAVYYLEDTN